MKTTASNSKYYPSSALFALAAACLITGCSDPAENVHKSSGSTPETAPVAAPVAAKEFKITEDSKIEFVGSKVTGSHNGGFKKFTGTIKVADGKVVGTSDIKIDMDSTFSDSDRLTGHLKNQDFFDVPKFPTSTFTVTGIKPGTDGKQEVTGNLELHGVTKSITFPADISVSGDTATVKAEFAINRKDFGIAYTGKADDLIRDNVVLKLDIKATAPAGA